MNNNKNSKKDNVRCEKMKKIVLVNICALVALVATWCVADYLIVKEPEYPKNMKNIHRYNWAYWFAPLVPFVVNICALRKLTWRKRVLLGVAFSVGVSALLVGVLLTFGMWFHFAIGGSA